MLDVVFKVMGNGWHSRCPRCDVGLLYVGFAMPVEECAHCGLEIKRNDSGDGPAFFMICILGVVVVPLMMLIEVNFGPPLFVHALLGLGLSLGLALVLIRPIKAIMIALQYANRPDDFEPKA
jgi:uncharacterized protein (DUF983 family)